MNIFFSTLLKGACLFVLVPALTLSAQPIPELAPTQWREDLQYLQKLVHTKYSNLFYNVTEKQFDSAVNALEKKIGTIGDVQMRVEIVKLVAMFKVGHTTVSRRYGTGNELRPWIHTIPVRFYYFSDGVYIKSIDEQFKDAAGGKLLQVGNTGIDEVLEKLKAVVSFENEQGFKSMLPFYLNVPEYLQALGIIPDAAAVDLTYLKNGQRNTVTVKSRVQPAQNLHGNTTDDLKWVDAYQGRETPLWLRQPERIRYFEYLPASKTVYVRHSAVQNEPGLSIEKFFENVFRFIDSAKADKLILDIRTNGGGNNYLNKPVITGVISSRINKKGHFFVITGKSTFSAAQNLTNELEKYTEVIFAGEPTSENVNFYGDTRTEVLPNSGLNVNLSWLWWQNLDPRDKRQWTAPQLAADMSSSDYIQGRDPVMELVLNYTETEPVEMRMVQLIKEGKTDAALNEAKKYFNDPVYRYYKDGLEARINNAGYALMNENKLQEANKVLEINTRLFPNSANVYDSYAESFWKLSDKNQAIKYYKQAISLDPDGETGENARRMLKEIEKKGF